MPGPAPAPDALPAPAPSAGALTGTAPPPVRGLRRFGRPPRVMGVDVARGVAVIGMIGAHVGVTQAFRWGDVSTWTDLVHGRSSLLFALVAGISIALLTGGRTVPAPERLLRLRLLLVGRGAVVFALGVALELLGTGIAVILTLYGVLFVAVVPFLRWRRRHLLITAALLALVGPFALTVLGYVAVDAYGPGIDLVLFGSYPVTVWLALLLTGLAIGRSDLLSRRTALRLLVVGVALCAVGYGVAGLTGRSAASSSGSSSSSSYEEGVTVPGGDLDLTDWTCWSSPDYVDCYPDSADVSGSSESTVSFTPTDAGTGAVEQLGVLAEILPDSGVVDAVVDASPHSGGSAEIVGSGGFAMAIVGGALLLSRPLRWVLLPVAALGSMPLSAYAAHVVVIAVTLGAAGTAPDDALWVVLSLSLLVASTLWVQVVGRGPLERLAAAGARAMAGDPRRPTPRAEPPREAPRPDAP
ncbi:hypothetical protein ABID92_001288 [Frigoribacterium sp. PvP120]|uniref:heparan-alpha-glucosaminide N-acetyltransferase domain-containing protein n=1 Tax=unclassified Frigoribacterium TaxID=2627005 RepID=UPI001B71B7CD|nr:heparan-alpha-glucosaminide N-acetyltransferase domain-containing protein [Frigoribacterium sp. PvP121]MBP1240895.1 hypothetical protein [Frigoribacterium sp. PvP121]